MLSAYVDKHQKDLPYVMLPTDQQSMKPQAALQTPLCLAEVATPLDVMYELPPSLSNIPQHKWVWELKSRFRGSTVQLDITKVRKCAGKNDTTMPK
jgi:hypothetical protein